MPTSIRRMVHRIAVLTAALVSMGGLCLVAAPQSNAAEPTAAAQPHTVRQTVTPMADIPFCADSLTWRCVVLPRAATQAIADAPISEVAGAASPACAFLGGPAGIACGVLVNGSAGAVSYTAKQAIKKNECFALVYDFSSTILLRPTTQPCRV